MIDKSKVLKVYSGKPGCACGCLGSYYVSAESIEEAGKHRGYPYDVKDINPKMITRVVNILNKDPKTEHHGDTHYLSTPTRLYIAVVRE